MSCDSDCVLQVTVGRSHWNCCSKAAIWMLRFARNIVFFPAFVWQAWHLWHSAGSGQPALHTTLLHTTFSRAALSHTSLSRTAPSHTNLKAQTSTRNPFTHKLPHSSFTHGSFTRNSFTHNTFTHNSFTHNTLTHNSFPYNSLTHNSCTHSCFTYTTLTHTTLLHTTLSHNLSHTTLSHTSLSYTTFHTQLCHAQLFHTHNPLDTTLSHTTLSHTTLKQMSRQECPTAAFCATVPQECRRTQCLHSKNVWGTSQKRVSKERLRKECTAYPQRRILFAATTAWKLGSSRYFLSACAHPGPWIPSCVPKKNSQQVAAISTKTLKRQDWNRFRRTMRAVIATRTICNSNKGSKKGERS